MPRTRPEVPHDGALVIGKLFPNSFAWIIKTGPAVDRAALAAKCDVDHDDFYVACRIAADALLRARHPVGGVELVSRQELEGLIKATGRALTTKYCNHGSAIPKGKARVTRELTIIHAILRTAAVRVRESR
jgi:hypothetical protein